MTGNRIGNMTGGEHPTKKLERFLNKIRGYLHHADLSCQGAEEALAEFENYRKERGVEEPPLVQELRNEIARARKALQGPGQT
jgi:hypothetical protein